MVIVLYFVVLAPLCSSCSRVGNQPSTPELSSYYGKESQITSRYK